jgi:hypothetical protein
MKEGIVGLTLLLVASCGMEEAECTSEWFEAAGLKICDNDLGVSADEVKLAVETLESDLTSRERYTHITNLEDTFKKKNIEVIFTDEDLGINCRKVDEWGQIYYCERTPYGVNIDHVRSYVTFNECLAWTALVHELLHSIEYFYLGVEDGGNHDTPEFFIIGQDNIYDKVHTVEYTVEYKLAPKLERCNL